MAELIPFSKNKITDSGERLTFGSKSAIREPDSGKGRPALLSPFALERLSQWCELGATKYVPHNWCKGMPFSRYADSMGRHYIAFLKGDTSEDHLAALAWNAFAIMHHQSLGQTQWDDMPRWQDDDWYNSIGVTNPQL